jgi:hypothetical protein
LGSQNFKSIQLVYTENQSGVADVSDGERDRYRAAVIYRLVRAYARLVSSHLRRAKGHSSAPNGSRSHCSLGYRAKLSRWNSMVRNAGKVHVPLEVVVEGPYLGGGGWGLGVPVVS